MATTATAKSTLSMQGTLTKTGALETTVPAAPKIEQNESLTSGVAAQQCDLVYSASGTLAAGEEVTLDLNGVLKDWFGDDCNFINIRSVVFRNTSDELDTATTAEIEFGGGTGGDGTNAWDTWITSTADDGSECLRVKAGDAIALFSPLVGHAVVAATGDILRIDNVDGTYGAQYEILIIGCSS